MRWLADVGKGLRSGSLDIECVGSGCGAIAGCGVSNDVVADVEKERVKFARRCVDDQTRVAEEGKGAIGSEGEGINFGEQGI